MGIRLPVKKKYRPTRNHHAPTSIQGPTFCRTARPLSTPRPVRSNGLSKRALCMRMCRVGAQQMSDPLLCGGTAPVCDRVHIHRLLSGIVRPAPAAHSSGYAAEPAPARMQLGRERWERGGRRPPARGHRSRGLGRPLAHARLLLLLLLLLLLGDVLDRRLLALVLLLGLRLPLSLVAVVAVVVAVVVGLGRPPFADVVLRVVGRLVAPLHATIDDERDEQDRKCHRHGDDVVQQPVAEASRVLLELANKALALGDVTRLLLGGLLLGGLALEEGALREGDCDRRVRAHQDVVKEDAVLHRPELDADAADGCHGVRLRILKVVGIGHLLGAPHANVVRVVDLGRRPLALVRGVGDLGCLPLAAATRRLAVGVVDEGRLPFAVLLLVPIQGHAYRGIWYLERRVIKPPFWLPRLCILDL
mmetsp:Transcript_35670/g.93707  ORF Transcript_35670/g.93707 Transcript_35670/m.93707 type:complete len:418 (-) Transcript_35670:986-2239(-)